MDNKTIFITNPYNGMDINDLRNELDNKGLEHHIDECDIVTVYYCDGYKIVMSSDFHDESECVKEWIISNDVFVNALIDDMENKDLERVDDSGLYNLLETTELINYYYENRFKHYDLSKFNIKTLESYYVKDTYTPRIFVGDIVYAAMDPEYWTMKCIDESVEQVRIVSDKLDTCNESTFYETNIKPVEILRYNVAFCDTVDDNRWVDASRIFANKDEARKQGIRLIQEYADKLGSGLKAVENKIKRYKGYIKDENKNN